MVKDDQLGNGLTKRLTRLLRDVADAVEKVATSDASAGKPVEEAKS